MKTTTILRITALLLISILSLSCHSHSTNRQVADGTITEVIEEKPDTVSFDRPVFTLVSSKSETKYIDVFAEPSFDSKKKTWISPRFIGLADGFLIEEGEVWSLVSRSNIKGWVLSDEIEKQTWYTGNGGSVLVTAHNKTPLFTKSLACDGDEVFYDFFLQIDEGIILADRYDEDEQYFILRADDESLYVKKKDVIVESVAR